jgi:hypothetical protein
VERVTGIGGVFIRSAQPDALRAWYAQHLGIELEDAMLVQLRDAGVVVDDNVHEMEFGRFGWAVDLDGKRFELSEPAEGL